LPGVSRGSNKVKTLVRTIVVVVVSRKVTTTAASKTASSPIGIVVFRSRLVLEVKVRSVVELVYVTRSSA
jgi:hypothetical protein